MIGRRTKIFGLFLAIGLVGTSAALNVFAMPAQGWQKIYYSDASKTEAVGWEEFMCTGTRDLEGDRSAYYDYASWQCSDPPEEGPLFPFPFCSPFCM